MNNVNDIRTFGLSQYAATSVTEVSNVDQDVDFTEAGLILILYQQHSPIKLLIIILTLGGLGHHVKGLLSYRKLMS